MKHFATSLTVVAALLVSGCDWNQKPDIGKYEKLPLNHPMPAPVDMLGVEWIVVTPENAEAVFAKIKASGEEVVLFAMTDNNLKALIIDLEQAKNLVILQNQTILAYKKYYESKPDAEAGK